MNERLKILTDLTLAGKMHPQQNEIEFDRMDLLLPKHTGKAKRIHDYVLAQKPVLTPYQTFTGLLCLEDERIPGDYMRTTGLSNIHNLLAVFYDKPIDNLSTFEWQHATADYARILQCGITGLLREIDASRRAHAGEEEKLDFLNSMQIVADTLIEWAHLCAAEAEKLATTVCEPSYRANLQHLASALQRVPEHPATTFYEAILSIILLFGYDPDSLGTLDRTLRPYYESDLQSGRLTREAAKEMLQELFLTLQANTPISSSNFTRGGESHFCVGGYNERGEDSFDDLSLLILEAMTELPTYIPQISLRWTKKLPFETFYHVLNLFRRDKNNRIAFINDEVKMKGVMNICGMPYEVACRYTSVGCNEVAFPGSFFAGTTNANILRSVEKTFFERESDILQAKTWEDFFAIYCTELFRDIDLMLHYEDEFMKVRAEDVSYVTSLLFDGCIKEAKTFTRGACQHAVAGFGMIGLPNVYDSLTVVKQFVYDEKRFTMQELVDALKNDWHGYEDMRAVIAKCSRFFGNDSAVSNDIAALWNKTLYEYTKGKTSALGYHYLFGNLQGYEPHHQIFGSAMRATPDGRHAGDALKFGIGQSGGYDREGLTALLHAVAKCDPYGIITAGPSVTNLYLDEKLITDEEQFLKTAHMLAIYFQSGGSQFQINYVSQEELKAAQKTPEPYKNLRVRVSGFSDYFVNLEDSIQNDIIARTEKSN